MNRLACLAFLLTASCSFASSEFQFQSKNLRLSYSNLSYLVVADVDGDGKPDIVTTDVINYTVSVLLGKGDGTFGAPKAIRLYAPPLPVVLADFNGDGKLDIVIGESDGDDSQVELYLGKGDGTFGSAAAAVELPSSPLALAVGDFNGDGKLDVAVEEAGVNGFALTGLTNLSAGNVQILAGDGKGSLRTISTSTLDAGGGLKMATGDFNHDGKLDAAFVQLIEGGLVVMLGLGNGRFQDPVHYPGVSGSQFNGLQLAATDLNRDGNLDLLVTTGHNNAVLIYYGNADGTFQPFQTASVHDSGGLAIADFDGDGFPDLAVATTASFDQLLSTEIVPTIPDPVVIVPGTGKTSFGSATNPVGQAYIPLILETADFNGDGLPDLIADNVFLGSVTVMINQTPQAAQAFTVVSAAAKSTSVAPEELASGYGSNLAQGVFYGQLPLSTALGGVTVEVQDSAGVLRKAPLIYVSPSQINFQVPAGSASGTAQIQVGDLTSTVRIQDVAPTLFSANSNGSGVAAGSAVRVDNGSGTQTPLEIYTCPVGGPCVAQPIGLDNASTVYVTLYGTGLRGHGSAPQVTCNVHGNEVPVSYAGPQPAFVGLDQVNIALPGALAGAGSSDVVLSVNGQVANRVTLSIQ